MKTAVSIPDEIFQDAGRLARRSNRSRSELYSRALAEYVARHAPDHVTEEMNRAVTEAAEPPDAFAGAAARRTLRRAEW
jgi:metal-responsive CopG/Arc/MetJ family transcriptional regulator